MENFQIIREISSPPEEHPALEKVFLGANFFSLFFPGALCGSF
jgi:hypothetical protein